ncbi:MAG: ABC transporter permease [Dictyoglomaceae bacterium]|nr:ABC transporter permease [Dictyoglomaceae bacterium]
MAVIKRFYYSFVLAWKIWSNWAQWWIFFGYLLVRPIFGVAILYMVIYFAQGNKAMDFFYWVLAGNALFQILSGTSTGMVWTILDDRDFYETLVPIYIAPGSFLEKVIGRSLGVGITGIFTSFFVLSLAFIFGANYLLKSSFFYYIILFLFTGIGFGLILASFSLFIGNGAGYLIEGTISALQLISGISFAPQLLPDFLQKLAFINPFLYLIEGGRRSLGLPSFFINEISSENLIYYSLITSVITIAIGILTLLLSEKIARRNGAFTRKINY